MASYPALEAIESNPELSYKILKHIGQAPIANKEGREIRIIPYTDDAQASEERRRFKEKFGLRYIKSENIYLSDSGEIENNPGDFNFIAFALHSN